MQVSLAHLWVDFRVICLGSIFPFSQEIDIGNVECSAWVLSGSVDVLHSPRAIGCRSPDRLIPHHSAPSQAPQSPSPSYHHHPIIFIIIKISKILFNWYKLFLLNHHYWIWTRVWSASFGTFVWIWQMWICPLVNIITRHNSILIWF